MVHVYIGSDHAGYKMKKFVLSLLKNQYVDYTDLGAHSSAVEDDYPDIAKKVCKEVLKDPKHYVGILLCGSGVGVCIAANRIKGIRAVLGWNVETALLSRRDEHANVLCFGGNTMREEQITSVLATWFTTPASDAERHLRRIAKLDHK